MIQCVQQDRNRVVKCQGGCHHPHRYACEFRQDGKSCCAMQLMLGMSGDLERSQLVRMFDVFLLNAVAGNWPMGSKVRPFLQLVKPRPSGALHAVEGTSRDIFFFFLSSGVWDIDCPPASSRAVIPLKELHVMRTGQGPSDQQTSSITATPQSPRLSPAF